MLNRYVILLYPMTLLFANCALGPLVTHETARTVGQSNHEWIGGFGNAGYIVKWNYGLTENLDIGLHYESTNIGWRAKYAFLNAKEGWSLASAFGSGFSLTGSYNNLDFIGSYGIGDWEPYGILRLVQTQGVDWHTPEGNGLFDNQTFSGLTLNYAQVMLGTRYWLTEKWMVSAELSALSFTKFEFTAPIYSAAFGYRF